MPPWIEAPDVSNWVDVVIAGWGAVGSATAYFLTGPAGFTGTVAVVEPDPAYHLAASTRSAASIRRQFSTPINIEMSAFGMEFLRAALEDLAAAQLALGLGSGELRL